MSSPTITDIHKELQTARVATERAMLIMEKAQESYDKALEAVRLAEGEEAALQSQLQAMLVRRGDGEQEEFLIHAPYREENPTLSEPPADPTGIDCWERWSGIDE